MKKGTLFTLVDKAVDILEDKLPDDAEIGEKKKFTPRERKFLKFILLSKLFLRD